MSVNFAHLDQKSASSHGLIPEHRLDTDLSPLGRLLILANQKSASPRGLIPEQQLDTELNPRD